MGKASRASRLLGVGDGGRDRGDRGVVGDLVGCGRDGCAGAEGGLHTQSPCLQGRILARDSSLRLTGLCYS